MSRKREKRKVIVRVRGSNKQKVVTIPKSVKDVKLGDYIIIRRLK